MFLYPCPRYGKSLCYILLPSMFDELRKVNKRSIALVVSPLIALMRDQIANITAMGVSATRISDKEVMDSKTKDENGEFQILFISPEALISMDWRNMLCSNVYRQNLIAL